MSFGSLFAGIGGFDLGLERAGMTCAWQVEREPYAVRVLEKHWPNVRRHDDVCTFPPEEGNWEVDLICGGFPCQDISCAGKGAGLAGERSGLWHEMHRIIGELRPRFVIVENVAALLSRGMETVLGELTEIGYDAEWHVIPACAVGAPHRRDRVWIVAFNADREHDNQERKVSRELCANTSRVRAHVADTDRAGREKQRRPEPESTQHAAAELSGWWETEPAMGRVVDGLPHRVDRLRGLGNAVVPQIVELIGRAITESLGGPAGGRE
ncbi:MAG: DNA cytosine methyltransferase [Ilumatobacteraceae bacterium]